MDNAKPLVSLACICERVLEEKDGVLSLVRIVDVLYLERTPEQLADKIKPVVDFTIVASLKSGSVKGVSQLELSIRLPSGEVREAMHPQPIILKGDEHGTNVVARVLLAVKETGLVWCDVIWEGEVLTSIPIRLKWREDEAEQHES